MTQPALGANWWVAESLTITGIYKTSHFDPTLAFGWDITLGNLPDGQGGQIYIGQCRIERDYGILDVLRHYVNYGPNGIITHSINGNGTVLLTHGLSWFINSLPVMRV